MALMRRITLVISILFCGSLALAAAAMAAGGGGGLGPGDYVFASTNARAQFGFPSDPTQATGFDVFVSKGLNSFQLDRPKKSPPVVSESTIVNMDVTSPTGGSSFCFVLSNQGDFTVSPDLKTASLNTLLMPDEMCTFGGPVTGKAGVTPFAGGGGGTGPQPPFKVNITWTTNGVTGSGKDRSTFSCGNFTQDATSTSKTAGENATGTIDALNGSFSSSTAGLQSNTTHLEVAGAPLQGCFG